MTEHTIKDVLENPPEALGVEVVYTKNVHEAETWLRTHITDCSATAVGFDLEWKTQTVKTECGGTENKTAVLQLGVDTSCLVLHIYHMETLPDLLGSILKDATVSKIGSGIDNDVLRLERDRGLVCCGFVETQDMALSLDPSSKRVGLKELVKRYLGIEVRKNEWVARSNWENFPLKRKQRRYAALDAWFGLKVFYEMKQRIESKRPEKLYKEPAVRVPTLARLSEIASSLGLEMGESELMAYRGAISNTLADTYQRLYELPDPKLPVKYPRTSGYRPSPEDNPYNAWYWRCDIRGASSGKLHGKTVAIKDNTCVAGVPMMNGSLTLEGFVPDVDATVVSLILDAGGNIIGKSVCEDLCCSGGSFTAATGPVVNPHNNTRMCGGSSSGSAALVAGGQVDMATGGDQGGSIRIPAACCGIVGLKPTYGLVPYTGIMPIEFTLDHTGPMARTVYDTALMLEAMAGYDGGLDPRQPQDLKVPKYTLWLTGKIDNLKIGILKEGFGLKNSEADVDKMVRDAAEQLGTAGGAIVEEVSVPMHSDGVRIFGAILHIGGDRMMFGGAGAGTSARMYYDTTLQGAFSRGLKCHSNDLSKSDKLIRLIAKYLHEDYHSIFYGKAQNLGRELCKEYDAALEKYDVLILPTIPKKAPVFPQENPPLKEYLARAFESVPNTSPTNVTGHPALSINAGFSEGLPVGMMIVGRKFDEITVLNVAYAYEKIRDA